MDISNTQVLIRLLVAVLVGCLFGMERRRRLKPVGMRTHALICLSCTVITMISAYGFAQFHALGIATDPARLMVGILTGIGFIGAGLIWKNAVGTVQGVTTAADILLLTALGMSTGLGLYFLTAAASAIGFLTLESDSLLSLWHKLIGKNQPPKPQEQKEDQPSGHA